MNTEDSGKKNREKQSLRRIFDVIEQYNMISPGARVVTGVSGGADSVCLLYVLYRYREQVPFELMAVHVEHGIRGEESLLDAAYTQEICECLQVPCRVVSVPVQQIAAERGLSVEEAGRMERYRIFSEVSREWDTDVSWKQNTVRIAVAHNQNDQAETVLWNLARGSGLKGLGGIRPVRGQIIRPLLYTGRAEIEQILRDAGISWRTDRTNLEEDYTRNKIRLSLLPQMEQGLNAQVVEHIAGAAEKLQQIQGFLERMTEQEAQRCLYVQRRGDNTGTEVYCEIESGITENKLCSERKCILEKEEIGRETDSVILKLEPYREADELIRTELLKRALELLQGGAGLKDIGSVHLEMLAKLTEMDCGRECHLPGQIRAVRENGIVRLTRRKQQQEEVQKVVRKQQQEEAQKVVRKQQQDEVQKVVRKQQQDKVQNAVVLPTDAEFDIPGWHVKTQLLENAPALRRQILEENKYTKWIDYDIIKNSVQLRTRQSGDYLIVGAQGGRKKLKDYFIDLKVPRDQRDQILLLADGSHILWVVGYRISEASKVQDHTKQILKIQISDI